jgi:hypothetical protein
MNLSLLDEFERMHMHHISVSKKTKQYCRKKFTRLLRSFKEKPVNKTYTSACTDDRRKQCRYVIRVFNEHSHVEFAHELKILELLSNHKVDFIPKVHTAFLCDNYGLLVQDKWNGDILDLLFSQKEPDLKSAYDMSLLMLKELHKLGLCYGKMDFQNLIYVVDHSLTTKPFRLGLQDWRRARPRTDILVEQDEAQLKLLFSELQAGINALKERSKIPDHLPHAMRLKFLQLRKEQL